MQCFCIRGTYDFHIEVIDSQTIIYTDLSQWVSEEPYIIPEKHEVIMTLPSSAMININVNVKSTTLLKADEIGLQRFKDGIYCFAIDALSGESGGCGISYSKSMGIFPNIECCLQRGFSKLDDNKYEDLKNVEQWLDRAKLSSQLGMEDQSLKEWKTARTFLSKLNCECEMCQ